jgi:hypothetical protein
MDFIFSTLEVLRRIPGLSFLPEIVNVSAGIVPAAFAAQNCPADRSDQATLLQGLAGMASGEQCNGDLPKMDPSGAIIRRS